MRRLLVGLVALAACSGGATSGPPADGGDAGADHGSPPELTPPDIPWLDAGRPPIAGPQLTPCPPGWHERTDPDGADVVFCDPWPETGRQTCTAVDETHFPGEPGCTRIGTACDPSDPWATDLPADSPVRYALAGAPPGGDGTRAAPFPTIGEALIGVSAGTVVAVGKGTYDEAIVVPGGVTLWGACVAETLVASSEWSAYSGTVNAGGRAGVVRNLRVGGRRAGVVAFERARSIEVSDVVVESATYAGLWVSNGARLTATRLAVRGTRPEPGVILDGRGLEVTFGATADVRQAAFERNIGEAILGAVSATSIRLEDVAITDTRTAEGVRNGGQGLGVQDGATVEGRRVVFERNQKTALFVSDAGSAVTLTDVVVRDTRSLPGTRTEGSGLCVEGGARVELSRALLERNRQLGVIAVRAGSRVVLSDVVVRDTLSQEGDGTGGRGLEVNTGATAEVVRAEFARNREVAIFVANPGTVVVLSDVVARDTEPQRSDGLFGKGLEVVEGAAVEVGRAAFERNHHVAVGAIGAGTTLTLEDALVSDTGSLTTTGEFGRGLQVQTGATVEVARALFERNREVTVFVADPASGLTLSDVVVRDTLERECVADTCVGLGGGTGVGAYAGAHLNMTRFRVTRSVLCGIQLAYGVDESGASPFEGGTMDLRDGEVSYNAVCGANVQTEGFDVTRLMDRVWYHDNVRNLDSSVLPVPGIHAWGE